MKKRILATLSALALILALNTNMVFAGNLELVDSYPKDGGKGMQVENAGVKLYFNHDMSGAKVKKANADCFKFVDEKGKAIPTKAFYSPKEKGVVLVLVDDAVTLNSDSAYKLIVSKDIIASNAKLDAKKDIEINFTTVNTKSAIRVNMVMMGIMMAGMIFMSSRANKIKENKDKEEHILEEKVNPYKIAKEKGVPVETVIEELERKKEKARVKLEKKQAKLEKQNKEYYEQDDEKSDNKKVVKKASAAAAGSKYVSNLRAKKAKK
ncbi:MAG: hypothetical protein ACTTH0_01150 [Eubacteriales bacterium]